MKVDAKDLVKRIKTAQKASQKANYTFRLPTELMKALKAKCGSQDVAVTTVIEELVREFVKSC